jgi:N-acyl-D-aspartate/D-glutamate deacylase
MLDLVIKGGVIVDGTGRTGFRGDVGVADHRIVEVGEVSTPSRRTVSADGLLVTPGFVDIHTHFDGQATWDPDLAPSCHNGVTSIVMGNCGVGFAPARPDKHEWLIKLLEGVEDIPGTALAEGINWEWESFPEYLDALGRRRYTMDVAAYVPHAALRAFVMGDRGADFAEHPTAAEVAAMRNLTLEAVDAGAVGFSTSRTHAHVTREGRNIGTLKATESELLGIVDALRELGRGAIQLVSDAYQSPDEELVRAELRLIRALASCSGRPTSFTLMQAPTAPGRWRKLLDAAADMSREGLTVRPQVGPRPIGAVLSFAARLNPFQRTRTYSSLADLPHLARMARLREASVKQRILVEFASDGGGMPSLWDFGWMFRMENPVDYDVSPERSLADEARAAGRGAADYVYDLLLQNEGTYCVMVAAMNFSDRGLNAVHQMLSHPNVLFGLSDAGAHVGLISDASFPTTTLSLWGKGDREGRCIPVETLINGYTQRNAAHVGWLDRGVIAPGYLADLNLIDLDALEVAPPHMVADLPAGGSRLLQTARGYKLTIKRGQVTVVNGELTGERPGGLVRGPQP